MSNVILSDILVSVLPIPGTAQDAPKPARQALRRTESIPALGARPPLTASFSYDRALRQVIVTLQRPDTGAVVAQFPPDKVLQLIAALMNLANKQLDEIA
jgi:hypothetical protein